MNRIVIRGLCTLYFRFFFRIKSCLFLFKFILSYVLSFVEGRRYEREDFWPAAKQKILTRQEEEALASQQETQMIYFIQQVGSTDPVPSTTTPNPTSSPPPHPNPLHP